MSVEPALMYREITRNSSITIGVWFVVFDDWNKRKKVRERIEKRRTYRQTTKKGVETVVRSEEIRGISLLPRDEIKRRNGSYGVCVCAVFPRAARSTSKLWPPDYRNGQQGITSELPVDRSISLSRSSSDSGIKITRNRDWNGRSWKNFWQETKRIGTRLE